MSQTDEQNKIKIEVYKAYVDSLKAYDWLLYTLIGALMVYWGFIANFFGKVMELSADRQAAVLSAGAAYHPPQALTAILALACAIGGALGATVLRRVKILQLRLWRKLSDFEDGFKLGGSGFFQKMNEEFKDEKGKERPFLRKHWFYWVILWGIWGLAALLAGLSIWSFCSPVPVNWLLRGVI